MVLAVALALLSAAPDLPVRQVSPRLLVAEAEQAPLAANREELLAMRLDLDARLREFTGPAPTLLIIFGVPNVISGAALGVFGVFWAGLNPAPGWGVLIIGLAVVRFVSAVVGFITAGRLGHVRKLEVERLEAEKARLDGLLNAPTLSPTQSL